MRNRSPIQRDRNLFIAAGATGILVACILGPMANWVHPEPASPPATPPVSTDVSRHTQRPHFNNQVLIRNQKTPQKLIPHSTASDNGKIAIETLEWMGREIEAVQGEVLLGLRPGLTEAEAMAVASHLGAQALGWTPELGALRVATPAPLSVASFALASQAHPAVLAASPNRILRAASHCKKTTATLGDIQWSLDRMDSGSLCDEPKESDLKYVRVAILDSGLAYGAATDAQGTYAKAPGLAHIDMDILPGSDTVNLDDVPGDDHYHGTHIASIIASRASIAGVAPNVEMVPIKVLDAMGVGSESSLAEGLLLAANADVDIINLSVAFDPGYRPSWILQEAIRAASTSGAILVGSSGNAGADTVQFPGAFPDVIAVGATRLERYTLCDSAIDDDIEDVVASYSSGGPGIDLMAPGGSVIHDRNCDSKVDAVFAETIQTRPKDTQAFAFLGVTGTSQAAANATGVLAWLVGENPGIDGESARRLLIDNATAIPGAEGGFSVESGAGIVQGTNLVSAQPPVLGSESLVNILPVFVDEGEGFIKGSARIEVLSRTKDGHITPLSDARLLGAFAGSAGGSFEATTDAHGIAWVDGPTLSANTPGEPIEASLTIEVLAVLEEGQPFLPKRPKGFYQLGEGSAAALNGLLNNVDVEGTLLPTSESFVFFELDPQDPSLSHLTQGAELIPSFLYKTLGSGGSTAPMATIMTAPFLAELQEEALVDPFTLPLGDTLSFSWGESDTLPGRYFEGLLDNLPGVSSAVVLPMDGNLSLASGDGALILNAHWETWDDENEGLNSAEEASAIATGYSATLFGTGYSATLFGTITQQETFYREAGTTRLVGAGGEADGDTNPEEELGACTVDGCDVQGE